MQDYQKNIIEIKKSLVILQRVLAAITNNRQNNEKIRHYLSTRDIVRTVAERRPNTWQQHRSFGRS